MAHMTARTAQLSSTSVLAGTSVPRSGPFTSARPAPRSLVVRAEQVREGAAPACQPRGRSTAFCAACSKTESDRVALSPRAGGHLSLVHHLIYYYNACYLDQLCVPSKPGSWPCMWSVVI